MTGPYGISPRVSPSMCPRCGTRVDLTANGTVAPHNTRVAGPSCDGSGMAPGAIPPWPGTVKLSTPIRMPRVRFTRSARSTRSARRQDATPAS